jgi:hypothetical protein
MSVIIAPQRYSAPWFNALYAKAIGTSFRPGEAEFLVRGSPLAVGVVKVKR